MQNSDKELKALNIIRREELRFKELKRAKEIVYLIVYYRSMITRSPIQRAIFETWLKNNKNYSTLLS